MDAVKAFESRRVTLWHGRAENVLPQFATESFDLVVTDPPYGQQWQSGQRSERFPQLEGDGSDDESRRVIAEVLAHCVRLTAQSRHLYVFGPFAPLSGLKVSAPAELIWHKEGPLGGGDLSKVWAKRHEQIQFVVSKHRHAGAKGKEVQPVRLRRGSVLRYGLAKTGREVRHPTEKPVALLTELLESSSRQGDTILDPFAGVASTGVAAVLSRRRAVLVEADERWVPVAVQRLQEAERLADQMESV